MAFTSAQLADIRRFCGYGAYGNAANAFFSVRYFQAEGTLEYKMANLSTDEFNVVVTTYLTSLYTLETDIFGVRVNLDTDTAAVWKHNKNELADRKSLFAHYRRGLCDFLGVPYGPALADNSRMVL